jgi:hypothetical protein
MESEWIFWLLSFILMCIMIYFDSIGRNGSIALLFLVLFVIALGLGASGNDMLAYPLGIMNFIGLCTSGLMRMQ